MLPALFQNVTPHTTLARPDISWLFYGPQILIIAYGVFVPRWPKRAMVHGIAWIALASLVFFRSADSLARMHRALNADTKSGREEVAMTIGEDMRRAGRREAAIRYDFLPERPAWCWVVSYSALHARYYIGVQYDYLLETQYDVTNSAKTPDGWVDDPDYVVVVAEGMDRYKGDGHRFRVLLDAGGHLVLQPRPSTDRAAP